MWLFLASVCFFGWGILFTQSFMEPVWLRTCKRYVGFMVSQALTSSWLMGKKKGWRRCTHFLSTLPKKANVSLLLTFIWWKPAAVLQVLCKENRKYGDSLGSHFPITTLLCKSEKWIISGKLVISAMWDMRKKRVVKYGVSSRRSVYCLLVPWVG